MEAAAGSAVWQPGASQARALRRAGRRSQLAGAGALAALALTAWWCGPAAFAGGVQQRPAGRFAIVEELPRGLVCRASLPAPYAEDGDREEWHPLPQWRGEKTYHPNRDLQADEHRQWYHFDAEGKVLGHLAQAVAAVLRGKDSPLYDPIRDVGAFVIVTNCEKVRVSGKKFHYKLYFRNLSFRPGHMKVERFKDLQKRFPERIIMRAVWGAMPKTPSSRRVFKDRLKLFSGPNHLYYHQDPVQYPMHTVKDCTPAQNLRKRDRFSQYYKMAPAIKQRGEALKFDQDARRLRQYKEFLMQQYAEEGPEAAERLELDELAVRGERRRMAEVLKANEGKPTPKKKVPMVVGLRAAIPRKRVSSRR